MLHTTTSVVTKSQRNGVTFEDEHEELGSRRIMETSTLRDGAPTNPSHESRQREVHSLQPTRPPPRPRRKYVISSLLDRVPNISILLVVLATLILPSNAVFVNFENCLDRGYRELNSPKRLQFTPLHVWASFNTSSPSRHLNITIYGNVSGQDTQGPYPPPGSFWDNDDDPFGKIVNVSKTNNKYTTLMAEYNVLTYTAHRETPAPFCSFTVNKACPLKPDFSGDANLDTLPGFAVGHDFYSSYSFATFASTMRIISGDANKQTLGCVSVGITPDLGSRLAESLCYLPAAVLALVAIATVFAATCSPWGASDIFRWSSNYGRDEDLLRLVTPGFGDCLQYIQFIVLAGSLNLQYPGFFQPVVSQASWSVLLFNESLVSKGNGSESLVDGIYFANGTYGLSRLGQLVGMSEDQDIWAGMAVWLLGLIGVVTLIAQLLFFIRWAWRTFTDNRTGDLRGKNFPFTAGNIVRIVFNFFMLPIISLSLFQLVVAPDSAASVVACAVILLIAVTGVATWIFWFIFTTRPRAHLFDDLPTVLGYGPLYNTYSDDAAPFAFIPVLLTTIRGIAIGAIQPSGIAQIVILAICEVILILTLHAFRPFQSNTSMNAYHTFFAAVRLTSILLMIAFVPTLGVSESQKGWIGYAVLLLHAIVLVFGFFLNSLQTIIEVAARLCGAGIDQRGGLTKVFGKRQLSRRVHRHQRSSLNSNAAILAHDGDKQSIQLITSRGRSLSGSSAVLLNQPHGTGSQRASLGFDQFSQGGDLSNYGGTSPGTPGANATPWSQLGGGSGQSSRRPTMDAALENADNNYYRPPRPRKHTLDSTAPGMLGRPGSTDLEHTPYADNPDQTESGDVGEGPSSWSPQRSSITPAYLRMNRDDSDPALAEHRKNTDYSVRESDFYYGLRGPALSAQPTRKLKTGPADPMGPVSSATGWFKSLNLFGAKKNEKGKGFEVVRSTRIPPQMMPLDEEEGESPPMPLEPYLDSPGTPPTKKSPQHGSPGAAIAAGARRSNESGSDKGKPNDAFDRHAHRVSDMAPSLGPIETGGGIELPSRIGSRASRDAGPSRAPTIPRKSSRRTQSTDRAILESTSRLSTVMSSPPGTPGRLSAHVPSEAAQHLHPHPNTLPIRLPFSSTDPSPSPERSPGHSATSSMYRQDAASDLNQLGPREDYTPPPIIQAVSERRLVQNNGARTHLEASAEIVDRSRSVSTNHSGRSYRTR